MNIKSAVIATHTFSPGTSQALHEYMKRHHFDVYFIEHKLLGNPFSWTFGVFRTLYLVIIQRKTYHLYIGSNRLNAFIGVLLQKLGKVKKVVYFSPDWVESRLRNPLLNRFYQWLDYFCVKYADITWNSSAYMEMDPMMQERSKRGYPKEYLHKQVQVPDGTDRCPKLSLTQIDRYSFGFVGHLKKGMGLEMLIDSFKTISKTVPQAKLLIIGSGPIESSLRTQAQGFPIKFTGFIGNIHEVYTILSHCSFAVAPYEPDTISQYTDPGKIKVYFSLGLPVVVTNVPQISHEINRENCGLVIEPNQRALTDALTLLLTDNNLFEGLRNNVPKIAEKYSWDNIFDKALRPFLN